MNARQRGEIDGVVSVLLVTSHPAFFFFCVQKEINGDLAVSDSDSDSDSGLARACVSVRGRFLIASPENREVNLLSIIRVHFLSTSLVDTSHIHMHSTIGRR